MPPTDNQNWLHIMVGKILAGIEATQREISQVKDEVSAQRASNADMRDEVADMGARLNQAEKDITALQRPMGVLNASRSKAIGFFLALGAAATAAEFLRDILMIHSNATGH